MEAFIIFLVIIVVAVFISSLIKQQKIKLAKLKRAELMRELNVAEENARRKAEEDAERLRQKREDETRRFLQFDEGYEIQSVMRVVDESIEIVNSSKNYDTRKSRLFFVIDQLKRLIEKYPHRDDLRKALKQCEDGVVPVLTEGLRVSVEQFMTKAKLAKTIAGKTASANKALALLKECMDEGIVDRSIIKATAIGVKTYLHDEELKEIETRAQKFEFKGNFKKALDVYQDALFFLKNDEIDDSFQKNELSRIESKVSEMEKYLSKPPVKASKK